MSEDASREVKVEFCRSCFARRDGNGKIATVGEARDETCGFFLWVPSRGAARHKA